MLNIFGHNYQFVYEVTFTLEINKNAKAATWIHIYSIHMYVYLCKPETETMHNIYTIYFDYLYA